MQQPGGTTLIEWAEAVALRHLETVTGRILKYSLTSVSVVLSQVQTVRQQIPAAINGKSDD